MKSFFLEDYSLLKCDTMQSGRNFCHFLPQVTCRYTETFVVTAVQTLNLTIFIPVNVPAHTDQDPYIAIFWVMTSFSLVGQPQSSYKITMLISFS